MLAIFYITKYKFNKSYFY